MPQFHETGYGRAFFQHQLPELIKSINRMASALELQNELIAKEDNKNEDTKEEI